MSPRKNAPANDFAHALKVVRKALGVTQEAFDLKSSRTYVSSLERGLKSPTLNKVDDLAEVLGVHPLALLTIAYMDELPPTGLAQLRRSIAADIERIVKNAE